MYNNVLLDLACQHFIEDFYINIHKRYWSVFFFFLEVSLFGFGVKVTLASQSVLGDDPFFSISWKSLSGTDANSSLNGL